MYVVRSCDHADLMQEILQEFDEIMEKVSRLIILHTVVPCCHTNMCDTMQTYGENFPTTDIIPP